MTTDDHDPECDCTSCWLHRPLPFRAKTSTTTRRRPGTAPLRTTGTYT